VYDCVIIACTSAIEFIEGEEQGILLTECCDWLGQG